MLFIIRYFLVFIIIILCKLNIFALESFYLLPESFELSQNNGTPAFSIAKENDEIVAQMVFDVSYRSSLKLLSQKYADKMNTIKIIKLPVEPTNFFFLSDMLSQSALTVKNIVTEYYMNQVAVEIHFRNTYYTAEQIHAILNTPTIFGFIDAKISCTSVTKHKYCGNPLTGLLVNNQYRAETSPNEKIAKSDFGILSDYKSAIILNNLKAFKSQQELITKIKSYLFDGISCKKDLTLYDLGICETILRYSNEGNLLLAMRNIAENYFTKTEQDSVIFNQILSKTDMKISANINIDFENLRQNLNNFYKIISSGDVTGVRIPFVSKMHHDSKINFVILPEHLSWKSDVIELAKNKHLSGDSVINLSSLLGDYEIPVKFKMNISFIYDVVIEKVDIYDLTITDLEFDPNGEGYDLAMSYKQEIETIVNGYLSSEETKEQIKNNIKNCLDEIKRTIL